MVRGGRRKTGRQDWTQEGLMASETGLFVLLHVPDSPPLQGREKSTKRRRPSSRFLSPVVVFVFENSTWSFILWVI